MLAFYKSLSHLWSSLIGKTSGTLGAHQAWSSRQHGGKVLVLTKFILKFLRSLSKEKHKNCPWKWQCGIMGIKLWCRMEIKDFLLWTLLFISTLSSSTMPVCQHCKFMMLRRRKERVADAVSKTQQSAENKSKKVHTLVTMRGGYNYWKLSKA